MNFNYFEKISPYNCAQMISLVYKIKNLFKERLLQVIIYIRVWGLDGLVVLDFARLNSDLIKNVLS
jgi:hypothetical protein